MRSARAGAGSTLLPAILQNPDVERAIRDVFADPALRDGLRRTHGTGEGIGDSLMRFLLRTLRIVSEWLAALRESAPVLFWIVYVLMIVVALGLIAHIVWAVASGIRGQRRGGAAPPPAAAERRLRFGELRAEATALAAGGRRRDAVRRLVVAVLALVDERRVLRVAAGWTNRELFARLRDLAPHAELGAFEAAVEAVTYARREIDAGGFEELDGIVGQVAAGMNEWRDG